MWKLSESGDNYTIQALNDDCYVNGNGDGWNRTVDASESTGKFTITLNGDVWHIVSTGSYSPGSTFGPWHGTKTDGTDMNVAINKKNNATAVGEGANAPGFYLYSLPRPQDVTSTYITNPSFETSASGGVAGIVTEAANASINGWATTSDNQIMFSVANKSTDNSSGYGKRLTPADGDYYTLIRVGWNAGTGKVSQILNNLPAGSYTLSVRYKAAATDNTTAPTLSITAEPEEGKGAKVTKSTSDIPKGKTRTGDGSSYNFESFAWSTISTTFMLNNTANTTIEVSYNSNGKQNCEAIIDNFILTYEPFANATDYAALNEAIEAAEAHQAGFEVGEYAPYTNKDAFVLLASAKAINQDADNTQREVQTARTLLKAATWTANDGEVNAVFDGTFATYDTDAATPKGWTSNGANLGGAGNSRVLVKTSGSDYTQLTKYFGYGRGMYLRFDGNGGSTKTSVYTYGTTQGYTMPLKANTIYRMQIKAGGWDGRATSSEIRAALVDKNGTEIMGQKEDTPSLHAGGPAACVTYDYYFVVTTAGDYSLKITNPGNKDWCIIIGSIDLKSAAELPFSDAAAMPKYAPGTYPRVSVSRTLNTGENVWNTLVLPFDYTNADWAVRELSSSTEDNLSFSVVEGGAMTAGKPYLVRPNAAVTSIEAENVAVITTPAAVETEKYSFIPVFAPTTITGDGTNYFVATGTNKLYCAKADISTNGYRAYFHYTGENSGARSVFLNFDETDPTAINAIEAAEVESGALKDGKYLIGNKVVLVKNGVKYGTNGQKLN